VTHITTGRLANRKSSLDAGQKKSLIYSVVAVLLAALGKSFAIGAEIHGKTMSEQVLVKGSGCPKPVILRP
jgi:hypothetical protein